MHENTNEKNYENGHFLRSEFKNNQLQIRFTDFFLKKEVGGCLSSTDKWWLLSSHRLLPWT